MEKLNSFIKIMIIAIMAVISLIITTTYLGIIASLVLVSLLFIFLYILNKKYDMKLTEKQNSRKINIVLAIILFILSFAIRILLVKLLQISPESDFALLINASKELASRQ